MGARLAIAILLVIIVDGPVKGASLDLYAANTVVQTGIIEDLVRYYQRDHDVVINIYNGGALTVLARGREGKADIIITHHPPSETIFVAEGYGKRRYSLMANQFALFGPKDFNHGLLNEPDIFAALNKLYQAEVEFYVPHSLSGTYKKIDNLWSSIRITPAWQEYRNTQASSASTLISADLMEVFTFADMGTFLANRKNMLGNIIPLVRDHVALRNLYSVILVDKEKL